MDIDYALCILKIYINKHHSYVKVKLRVDNICFEKHIRNITQLLLLTPAFASVNFQSLFKEWNDLKSILF